MRKTVGKSLLVALWCAIVLWTIFTIIFGEKGIIAYNTFSLELEKLYANAAMLDHTGITLAKLKDALDRGDKDIIAMYARELGYAPKNERFLRIVGLHGTRHQVSDAGEILEAARPYSTPDGVLKGLSFFAGIIAFIISFLFFNRQKRPRYRLNTEQYTREHTTTKAYQFRRANTILH